MQGIRFRILFSVLIPLILLALLLGVFFVAARVDDARLDLEVQGQRFAQYLAAASEFNLLAGDRGELQAFAATQRRVSGVLKALAFIDAQGEILASSGDVVEVENLLDCYYNPGTCNRFEERLFFNLPMFTSGVLVSENPELNPTASGALLEREFLGRIVFFYDTNPLAKLQQQLMINGLFITLAAALLVSVVSLLLASALTRPIVNLSRVVNDIQQGDLSARVKPSGSGELLELENGVNAMAAKVEAANENLQLKVQHATRQLLDTLGQLKIKNRDLEEASKRVEEAGRVKALFLAKMSHELRTPLSSIIGYLKLLEDSDDSEKRKAYGKIVDQASAILLATIDDILDFIRLEDGQVQLESIEFNLRECLQNAVALQAPAAEKKQLPLECLIDPGVPLMVYGDPTKLAQIVTNLLNNAIKFTSEGYVRLEAKAWLDSDAKTRLVITVKDTGIGIAQDKLPLLFQPFVQAEDSISRQFGGSGLGLSIAQRLAQAMQGNITLESEAGMGAEATVTLQLESAAATVQVDRPAARPVTDAAILVVEDNELSRELIRIQLESEGAGVVTAEDGMTALALAEQHRFDLILLDVHMPGMDGISLTAALRKRLPAVPIVALTANITGSEEDKLYAAGIDKILYKPLNPKVIHSLLYYGVSRHVDVYEGPAADAEIETQSTLEVPVGIRAEDVTNEFSRLCRSIAAAEEDQDWDVVFDCAHKLLGSARLFTRGPFADLVYALENRARQRDADQIRQMLSRLRTEIDAMAQVSGQ